LESLIYYPNFEPPSEIWLKFSLLYLENFQSIVPYNKRDLLTDNFRRIVDQTDLVTLYDPNYNVGSRASLLAIEEVDKILKSTYDRSPLFGQVNVLRKWQNQANWKFHIHREKFSDNWVRFCVENSLGSETPDGILMHEEPAFLFMTYLGKEIAFDECAALITDNNKFDSFTNYARATSHTINNRNKFAKGIFNLLVPKNLSEIPFETLIQFRNSNRPLINAFNIELDNVQSKIGDAYGENDFINSYNNIYSDFSSAVLAQGIGIASIPFAAYMLIQNKHATSPEYVKEILGALGIILGGGYTLNKGLRDTKTKRYCKKYLTNLQRLK